MIKTLQNILQSQGTDFDETEYVALRTPAALLIIDYSNDDPGLTLTYFMAMSNSVT